jgi:hypothetical protein
LVRSGERVGKGERGGVGGDERKKTMKKNTRRFSFQLSKAINKAHPLDASPQPQLALSAC